jgi:hypothetical protein
VSDDEKWLVDIFRDARPDPGNPRVLILPLCDYQAALKYCRVRNIRTGDGKLFAANLEDFLRTPGSVRCAVACQPVSQGVSAFCGRFFHPSCGHIISNSFAAFSRHRQDYRHIRGLMAQLHSEYRDWIKGSVIPAPLNGPHTN